MLLDDLVVGDEATQRQQQQQQLFAAGHEAAIARMLVTVASALSLSCSLAMVLCFVVFQESRRCGRRILVCLHLADAAAAIAWLLTLWIPPPVDQTDTTNDTAQTPSICLVQGYALVFFMMASYTWTACFASHLYQILGRRLKHPELYEYRYHLLAWGIPASTVWQLLTQHANGFDLIGESGYPWCWFRVWSDYEWADDGFNTQLAVFYGPMLAVLLYNLSTYVSLLHQMSDVLSTRMEDRIWRRMMAYSWAFFLTFVWGFYALLYQNASHDHDISPKMLYLMSFFMPLQGAMNTVVYGFNKKLRDRVLGCCRRRKESTRVS
ncbi:hypothetical protein PINS_up003683 [Pythium insidiosum]|nr:hypothetical protein PINS_up003683 [Pythium insidiosum]